MGFFHHESEEAEAHERVFNSNDDEGSTHHKGHLSHELIAAAASYEAAKAYEDHEKKNGKPTSHEKAKEILAGFSGAAVDYLIETKGLDFIDKEKVKHDAHKKLVDASADDYE